MRRYRDFTGPIQAMAKFTEVSVLDSWRERAKKFLANEFWFGATVIAFLLAMYGLFFARGFLSGNYMFAGDTRIYWSLNYFTLYSIKAFNSLPWWDPTAYNGYPLYYHFLSGWSNYLSPFYLPSLILYKLLTLVSQVPISIYIAFHRTIYVVALNMTAIYLIGRQLVKSRVAAVLPVFIFSFSYFQLLNFHDFYTLEAMIAPLFFIYALIRYNDRRDFRSLIILVLFSALFCASMDNGIMMSAIFWTGIFTVLLVAFFPGILKDTIRIVRDAFKDKTGRIMLIISVVLLILASIAAIMPIAYNLGNVIKYRGDEVNYRSSGAITNHPIDIESSEIWTVIFNWVPFPEIHDLFLKFIGYGHDYRYIGLVTLPLTVAALILGFRNRYVYILLLTYFLCNAFIIYTRQNAVYNVLIDFSDIFRNIRNMATIFPRGGASLFLIFMSGIGLDKILDISRRMRQEAGSAVQMESVFAEGIRFLWTGLSLTVLVVSAVIFMHHKFVTAEGVVLSIQPILHTFFHIFFYLVMFTFLCRMLILPSTKTVAIWLVACLFIFTFTDLMVSVSRQIDRRSHPRYSLTSYSRIPYETQWAILDTAKFGPINNESENMFQKKYMGVYHNPWEIMWGMKSWLVLETSDNGKKFLTNWNRRSLRLTKFPVIEFYSNAYYIPFDKIDDVRTDGSITEKTPLFYLHDKSALAGSEIPRKVEGTYKIERFSCNDLVVKTKTAEESFLYYPDNYDRFWNVYIDGKREKILRANFTFKAVRLPSGTHTVKWAYDPYPVKFAYAAFYMCLAAFLITAYFFRMRIKT